MTTEDAPFAGYAPDEERPLAPYAAMSATYLAAVVGALAAAERRGHPVPESLSAGDIALLGVATHKISRVISKDKVTSFLRAPLARYQGPAGQGEVSEEPRGSGLRKAVGELLGCPYCLSPWVAGAFVVGLTAAPRATRLVAGALTAVTLADFLQLAYLAAEERAAG